MVKPCIQTLSFQLRSFTDFRGFVYTQLSGVFLSPPPPEVPKARPRQAGASADALALRFNDKLAGQKAAGLVYLAETKGIRAFHWRPDRAAGALRWGGGGQPTPPNASTGALGRV